MINLIYKKERSIITGDAESFYLEKITEGTPDTVRFHFTGTDRGVLILGEERYRFSSGTVDIPFSALGAGLHMPRVAVGCELIFATHFVKDGSEIKNAPISEGAYEKLRLAFTLLEGEVITLREEVASLREAMRGRELLKFN